MDTFLVDLNIKLFQKSLISLVFLLCNVLHILCHIPHCRQGHIPNINNEMSNFSSQPGISYFITNLKFPFPHNSHWELPALLTFNFFGLKYVDFRNIFMMLTWSVRLEADMQGMGQR